MEIGIVGLPNVGKSTLFNSLTGAGIAAENFPFTTIEPNVGIVPLPDERLNIIAEKNSSAKIVPDGIRFVDIAGLVEGASKGEGLGNKFLSHIRSVDAITHVIRCFSDDNVVNVTGELDPVKAADIIDTELMLADMQTAEGGIERMKKIAKSGNKQAQEQCELLTTIIEGLNNGVPIRKMGVKLEKLKDFQFLTQKPILYVANTDEGGAPDDLLAPLRKKAEEEGAELIALCTKLEAEILELPQEERSSYYEEAGITTPGLSSLAKAGQKLLNLVCYFTSGPNETRARLIPKGTMAIRAAGKIHTDMERGFIRAEVYKYDDLVSLGSYQAIQQKGLVRLEGKEYEIQEGDIVYYRFSV